MPRLRRSDTSAAGLQRVRHGRGLGYRTADGSPVTPADLDRIRLVIPPAWADVWISPHANGHLQATGVDAAGRRQYLYHPAWRVKRDREKHDQVLDFAACLPAARKAAADQLSSRGLTRDRVLAAAFTLLDVGAFRVGGDRYAEENGSFGLMTLRREHAHCTAAGLVFEYPAKSGKERMDFVTAAPVRSIVCALRRKRPVGQRLFAYTSGGRWHELDSDWPERVPVWAVRPRGQRERLPHLERDGAGGGRAGRLRSRRAVTVSPQTRGEPGRQGSRRLPGQHPGGMPGLLYRRTADRPVPGRGKGAFPDGQAGHWGAARLAATQGGFEAAVLRLLRD